MSMRLFCRVLFWKMPHRMSIGQVIVWLLCGWLSVGCWEQAAFSDDIDFQRDIRPLLSDACFQCHGPDESKRQADLRLDISEGAYADLDGRRVLVPGDPEASHLFLRVTHDDPDQRMPPADSVRQLTAAEIQLLRKWIEDGAEWNEVWSFVSPQRPALPKVQDYQGVKNPLDNFVKSRLDQAGIQPMVEASRETLIRRVTLDLTGLPPSLDEIDAFLNDSSPASFQRVIDRLLASPRYGERMAVQWLNAARYSDTSGYQMDGPRQMWRWRDWVIESFNSGMPFDQFTIEQCAGDLLPNPSLNQLIATGFHRNHRGNAEGGIISEEYRVEYVVDRVETTSTVWLGLTMGCARCHDHKYDPISQREFYQFFAFFNNVPERGKARKWGNSIPYIKAPTGQESAALAQLDSRIEQVEQRIADMQSDSNQAQLVWVKSLQNVPQANQSTDVDDPLVKPLVHVPFSDTKQSGTVEGETIDERWEGGPKLVTGRIDEAGEFDGTRFVELGDLADFNYTDQFSIGAWIQPHGEEGGAIVSKMKSDSENRTGYSFELVNGQLHINLVVRWLDDCIRVRSVDRLVPGRWYHVLMTYDGSRLLKGVQLFVDGASYPLEVIVDDLQQPFKVPDPLRVGARGKHFRFHGLIDEVCVFDRQLSNEEARVLATPETIYEIASLPDVERTENQRLKLRRSFVKFFGPEAIRRVHQELVDLHSRHRLLSEKVSTVMVMQEMKQPRDTYVLKRGRYDDPGASVSSDVPACLPPLSEGAARNRLGMAQWLVDPENPLTSRVAVNRMWQLLFGQGLVRSAEDFGSQGDKPSHPLLLDWLATEFVNSGWSLKKLQRLVLSSATYRQSSRTTADLQEMDPDNRLLSRGSRFRMSAEMIRDHALTVSGLLVERLGGPSVKPYQPPGLWVELTLEESRYVQDTGEDLYRRSLYTYWKRTVAPPGMMILDAPQRETCSVRDTRTNTPLQALTLLNDVTYVEAARALAQRVLNLVEVNDSERLTHAFRLVTSRYPSSEEIAVLKSSLEFHRRRFESQNDEAKKLTSFGDSLAESAVTTTELAAHTAVMNMLMNLDEAITRE